VIVCPRGKEDSSNTTCREMMKRSDDSSRHRYPCGRWDRKHRRLNGVLVYERWWPFGWGSRDNRTPRESYSWVAGERDAQRKWNSQWLSMVAY
jgi:hypothetical protein